eukprot:scaffold1088_cov247-Pinguiococcus_pyrenoidosus.AAC.21
MPVLGGRQNETPTSRGVKALLVEQLRSEVVLPDAKHQHERGESQHGGSLVVSPPGEVSSLWRRRRRGWRRRRHNLFRDAERRKQSEKWRIAREKRRKERFRCPSNTSNKETLDSPMIPLTLFGCAT